MGKRILAIRENFGAARLSALAGPPQEGWPPVGEAASPIGG